MLQSQCNVHSKAVLDDSLITADTTSLDQHNLYYCAIGRSRCEISDHVITSGACHNMGSWVTRRKKKPKKISVLNLFPANLAHRKLRKLPYLRRSFFSSFRHIHHSGGFCKVSELVCKPPYWWLPSAGRTYFTLLVDRYVTYIQTRLALVRPGPDFHLRKILPQFWANNHFADGDRHSAGLFCRVQGAGCRLKFNYHWKTAGTYKKCTGGRPTMTVTWCCLQSLRKVASTWVPNPPKRWEESIFLWF